MHGRADGQVPNHIVLPRHLIAARREPRLELPSVVASRHQGAPCRDGACVKLTRAVIQYQTIEIAAIERIWVVQMSSDVRGPIGHWEKRTIQSYSAPFRGKPLRPVVENVNETWTKSRVTVLASVRLVDPVLVKKRPSGVSGSTQPAWKATVLAEDLVSAFPNANWCWLTPQIVVMHASLGPEVMLGRNDESDDQPDQLLLLQGELLSRYRSCAVCYRWQGDSDPNELDVV